MRGTWKAGTQLCFSGVSRLRRQPTAPLQLCEPRVDKQVSLARLFSGRQSRGSPPYR